MIVLFELMRSKMSKDEFLSLGLFCMANKMPCVSMLINRRGFHSVFWIILFVIEDRIKAFSSLRLVSLFLSLVCNNIFKLFCTETNLPCPLVGCFVAEVSLLLTGPVVKRIRSFNYLMNTLTKKLN